MQEIRDAWRQLLPASVVVCAGPPIDNVPVITRAEERSAGLMGDGRKVEFAIGRAYAKRALSELGIENVELPVGPDGAPVWPEGVTGSITHTGMSDTRHFAAVVVRTEVVRRIGIDAEIIGDLQPSSWPIFLTASELGFVRSLSASLRARTASAIWCAKEAATKAMGCKIDPLEIEAIREHSNHEPVASWCVNLPAGRFVPPRLLARTAHLSILVLGAAIVAEGEP